MGSLNSLRHEVRQSLEDAGIRAIEYAEPKVVPPIAVVVPADPYVRQVEQSERTFSSGDVVVGVRVLLVAGKGTSKVTANEIDGMIEKAVVALDSFDVVEVSAPGEVNLNGNAHFGSIILIEAQLKIEEED